MRVTSLIGYNLKNVANFRGRQTRVQFWPYAAFVFLLSMGAMMLVMVPEILVSMERMLKFAAEHPELSTVESGPSGTSVTIDGYHPELMPDLGAIIMWISAISAVTIALLAAAVTRRLHDRDKAGWWGLLPVPFLAAGYIGMAKLFALRDFDMAMFGWLFLNNFVYLGTLIFLIVLLSGVGTDGDNRYGPPVHTGRV